MITAFVAGFFSSVGLSLIYNIRRRHIFYSALGGALATLIQYVLTPWLGNPYMPVFLAASFAGIYSELLAVLRKAPATTYVLPAIFPLVPGAGMYYTMLYLTEKNFSQAAVHGSQTIFLAITIACGIIIAPSFRRIFQLLRVKA